MNSITIHGRLTRDVELNTTSSGVEYAKFSVAVDRPKKKDGTKDTDYFNCVAWNKAAPFVEKYFKQGDGIIVSGSMEMSKKDDKTYWTLRVKDIEFPMGKKGDSSNSSNSTSNSTSNSFEELPEETGDLPF